MIPRLEEQFGVQLTRKFVRRLERGIFYPFHFFNFLFFFMILRKQAKSASFFNEIIIYIRRRTFSEERLILFDIDRILNLKDRSRKYEKISCSARREDKIVWRKGEII